MLGTVEPGIYGVAFTLFQAGAYRGNGTHFAGWGHVGLAAPVLPGHQRLHRLPIGSPRWAVLRIGWMCAPRSGHCGMGWQFRR